MNASHLGMLNSLFQFLLVLVDVFFFLFEFRVGANFFAFPVDCLLEVDFSNEAGAGYAGISLSLVN